MLIEQRSGQGVNVPPGWLHWVRNLQPNAKVAMEVLHLESATACIQMQQMIRCHFVQGQPAYMAVAERVKEELLRWHRWCIKQL